MRVGDGALEAETVMNQKGSQQSPDGAKSCRQAPLDPREKGRPSDRFARSLSESAALAHELEVQQVELSMQCAELERARLEADALRACYHDFYEMAPVGYCIVRHRGAIIVEANLTLANLLGVPLDELLNGSLTRFVCEEDKRPYFLHCKRLSGGERSSCEVRLLRGHKVPFWTSLVATPIANVDGVSSACRLVITDMSERKEIDAERSRMLAERLETQKMNAIGTLAGGIAHDFNNILAGILSGLELLEFRLNDASECLSDIRDMKSLVQRGARVAVQLLDFSRQGEGGAQRKPLELGQVVEKTSVMFGQAHPEIRIRCEVAPGRHTVLSDAAQISQVLLNLFANAAQAMHDGGELRLQLDNAVLGRDDCLSQGAAPGPFVKLVLTDNGPGMDAETKARVFEPFFTRQPAGQGSGLGLASAYGIVKNHGGMIRVESELTKGTSFTILLPATEKIPAEDAPASTATPAGTGRILVVDDEELLLNIEARLLRAMGYEVLTANRGRKAVELVREQKDRLSLVILDLTMPEMNGKRTLDALREVAPDLKVLLCSGYSEEQEAAEIRGRCCGFLQKPFDAATLSEKVRSVL